MQHASILPPTAITLVAATETRLLTGISSQTVSRMTIAVRSLGGGTYVGVGLQNATELRLLTVGDSYTFEGPPGYLFNAGSIFAKADGAAILEIICIVPEDV